MIPQAAEPQVLREQPPRPLPTRHQPGAGSPLTCLDLFCGCGGFTLGMQRAGCHVLAAVDFNPQAIATLRANLAAPARPGLIPVAHALERDLTRFEPADLAAILGVRHVDIIVGGPPCQGFSRARQVDGANHGPRLKSDPRRQLYRDFLRFVAHFRPRVFVIENVLGIRSAAGGEYFTRVQQEARELGYRVHGQVEDAWELGVPQRRKRQLIIGVRAELPGYFLPTQNRSLTPREAARIQSFPDWFRFPDARTHAFRLIGNAVPPANPYLN